MARLRVSSVVVALGVALLAAGVGCETSTEPPPDATVRMPAPPAPAERAPVHGIARGDIDFVEGYARGCEAARRSGKPMLIFFTASWCQYCHQMADEAFTQSEVVRLSRYFMCVLVDADAEPQVCRQFQVRGYPTIQFLAAGGAAVHRVTGKRPGHQLVIDMQTALQTVARLESGNVLR